MQVCCIFNLETSVDNAFANQSLRNPGRETLDYDDVHWAPPSVATKKLRWKLRNKTSSVARLARLVPQRLVNPSGKNTRMTPEWSTAAKKVVFCLWKPIRSPFRIVKHRHKCRMILKYRTSFRAYAVGTTMKTSWKLARCQHPQHPCFNTNVQGTSDGPLLSTQQSLVANGQRFWFSRTHLAAGPRNPASPGTAAMRSKWLQSDPNVTEILSWILGKHRKLIKKSKCVQPFPVQNRKCLVIWINMWKSDGEKKSRSQQLPNGCHLDASLQVFFLIIIEEVPFASGFVRFPRLLEQILNHTTDS